VVGRLAVSRAGLVTLLSIAEKGKTRALERAQAFVRDLSASRAVRFVTMMDADCRFEGRGSLRTLAAAFEREPRLCGVAANCLPDLEV